MKILAQFAAIVILNNLPASSFPICFSWCKNGKSDPQLPSAEIIEAGEIPNSLRIKVSDSLGNDHIYSFLGYKGITSQEQANLYNIGNFSVPKGTVNQGAEYGKGIYISDSLNVAQLYSKAGSDVYTRNSYICLMYANENNKYSFGQVKKSLGICVKQGLNKKFDVIIAPLGKDRQLLVTLRNPSNLANLKAFCRPAVRVHDLPGNFSYLSATTFAWNSRLKEAK